MIRDRLRELEIKISELSDYLKISRPTMYKFIESYDKENKNEVNKKVLGLFDYIEKNPLIGKRNVMGYILDNIAEIDDTDDRKTNKVIKSIKEYVSSNPESEKTQFMEKCAMTDKFDIAIHYLLEIQGIMKLKVLTEEQKKKIELYERIVGLYK